MKKLITLFSLLFTSVLYGQGGFTYSYVDPCSQQTKTIFVTGNQNVTVNYLGNIGSFSQTDFQNGSFDNWITQIQSQVNSSPCDELLTNTTTSQNMFITQNLISTLTSVTAVSSMTASNAISNSVSNSTPSNSRRNNNNNNNNGGGNGGSNSNNQQNTSNNGTSNNSQGNTSNSSSSTNGGNDQGGNSSSGSSSTSGGNQEGGATNQSGNVPQGGGGTSERGVGSQGQSQGQNVPEGSKQESGGGSGGGGITNSVSNASESSSGGGKGKGTKASTGSIIGTGDIVAIRVNEDKSNQLRGTMSVTQSNTNNTRSKGLLLNYTTTVNNSNLTFYGAFTNKKTNNVFIVANSSMVDFNRNFFNTTTALESHKFGKTSLMGGLNFTVGGLGGEMFTNLSAVGGGFRPFKVSKNLSGNILVLGVYSPFTKFYEGKWWDSGLLIVPFSSWDYTISKNFKYNVSISGTYELKGNFLQFQILTGGKILL
jgi:hypothetical protein